MTGTDSERYPNLRLASALPALHLCIGFFLPISGLSAALISGDGGVMLPCLPNALP